MGSGGTTECQETKMRIKARSSADEQSSSKKESIQPQVPLRLPCYDFTSVTPHTVTNIHLHPIKRRNFGVFGAKSFLFHQRSEFWDGRSPASGICNSQGVTGGVYKARVQIHRGVLIRDY